MVELFEQFCCCAYLSTSVGDEHCTHQWARHTAHYLWSGSDWHVPWLVWASQHLPPQLWFAACQSFTWFYQQDVSLLSSLCLCSLMGFGLFDEIPTWSTTFSCLGLEVLVDILGVVFLTFENAHHTHTDASWKICCWRWTAFCDLMAGQFSGMRWKSWMWYKRLWSRCTGMSNKWTLRRARRSLLCRRDFGDHMLQLRKWA